MTRNSLQAQLGDGVLVLKAAVNVIAKVSLVAGRFLWLMVSSVTHFITCSFVMRAIILSRVDWEAILTGEPDRCGGGEGCDTARFRLGPGGGRRGMVCACGMNIGGGGVEGRWLVTFGCGTRGRDGVGSRRVKDFLVCVMPLQRSCWRFAGIFVMFGN